MGKFKIATVLLLSILTLSCSTTGSGEVEDLISPVKLVAGKEIKIVISDLFYLENYDVNFKTNPNVNLNYN
jgi:hypothetical protein